MASLTEVTAIEMEVADDLDLEIGRIAVAGIEYAAHQYDLKFYVTNQQAQPL